MFRDDFEKLAHDIACVVMYGKVGGTVRQPVIERVAAMLRKGPGIGLWPKDHAEACQRAREAAFKRPVFPRQVPALPADVRLAVPGAPAKLPPFHVNMLKAPVFPAVKKS